MYDYNYAAYFNTVYVYIHRYTMCAIKAVRLLQIYIYNFSIKCFTVSLWVTTAVHNYKEKSVLFFNIFSSHFIIFFKILIIS